jgi:hypothetical protein
MLAMKHPRLPLLASFGRLASVLAVALLLQLAAEPVQAAGGSGNSGWWASHGAGMGGGSWHGGGAGWNGAWNRGGWNGNWNRGAWNGWNGGWNRGWNSGWNHGGWNGNWNGWHGGWWHGGWWHGGGWNGWGWWNHGWHGGWWGSGWPGWCCNSWYGSSISFVFPVAYPYYVYPYYPPYPGYPPAEGTPPAAPAATGPAPAQSWYYCNDPKGFYPYVQSCKTAWTAVPTAPPGMTQ